MGGGSAAAERAANRIEHAIGPADGAADDGAAEYVYRFAPLVGIYGGTLEVFRNMIAQYALGLGKPTYAAAKP